MPHIEKHAPGSFSWIELRTPDAAGARAFYGALFGWDGAEFPMGPDHTYTMFKQDGRDVGGCIQLGPERGAMPPHWGLFVTAKDADASAARAVELGGRVLQPVIDVFGIGRAAVLADPTGVAIGLWEPGAHIGIGIAGENGTLCWADLHSPDRGRAKPFYEQLFGWNLTPGKDKSAESYLHIQNGSEYIGGMESEEELNRNAPPHWLIYFLMADCDAATQKAQELGAKVYVAPTSVENNLRFSVIADPQGAVFALFTSLR